MSQNKPDTENATFVKRDGIPSLVRNQRDDILKTPAAASKDHRQLYGTTRKALVNLSNKRPQIKPSSVKGWTGGNNRQRLSAHRHKPQHVFSSVKGENNLLAFSKLDHVGPESRRSDIDSLDQNIPKEKLNENSSFRKLDLPPECSNSIKTDNSVQHSTERIPSVNASINIDDVMNAEMTNGRCSIDGVDVDYSIGDPVCPVLGPLSSFIDAMNKQDGYADLANDQSDLANDQSDLANNQSDLANDQSDLAYDQSDFQHSFYFEDIVFPRHTRFSSLANQQWHPPRLGFHDLSPLLSKEQEDFINPDDLFLDDSDPFNISKDGKTLTISDIDIVLSDIFETDDPDESKSNDSPNSRVF